MTQLRTLSLLFCALGATAARATWYTSEDSFRAAIDAANYTENFDAFNGDSYQAPLDGSKPSYTPAGANGYDWTARDSGGRGRTGLDSLCLNGDAGLGEDYFNLTLTLTFSGKPVSAFGTLIGDFSNATGSQHIDAGFFGTTSTIKLSTGESMSVVTQDGQQAFLGWVGTASFASATMSTLAPIPNPSDLVDSIYRANNDVRIDHVITGAMGQPVPEPASVAALGIGAIGLLRRRRKA